MEMGSPLYSFSIFSLASRTRGLMRNFDAFLGNGELHGVGTLIG